IVLADEINRATPKTQSALLEAMQERSVTVSGNTYKLDVPFFVLATQNPIEQEGTYPLPEAQMDRFIFKIIAAQHLIRGCIVAPHVKEYAARLVLATHPGGDFAPAVTGKYVRCGASPRAAQALLLGGKVRALTDARYHV